MGLLRKYANSKEGRELIKQETGMEYDPKFTLEKAMEIAEEFRRILFKHTHSVIPSITLNDIVLRKVKSEKGKPMVIMFSFMEDSMRRPSLNPSEYPKGLENIVVLFTEGYETRNQRQVHGLWHGKFVASRTQRPPNDFIQRAIDEFNNTHPSKYQAVWGGNRTD